MAITLSGKIAERLTKVREGLKKANVPEADITKLFEKFGKIAHETANDILTKLVFHVSIIDKLSQATGDNRDPDGRRQMVRALFFVMDLAAVDAKAPRPRYTQNDFDRLWKGTKFEVLQTMVKEIAHQTAHPTPLPRPPGPEVSTDPSPPLAPVFTKPHIKRAIDMLRAAANPYHENQPSHIKAAREAMARRRGDIVNEIRIDFIEQVTDLLDKTITCGRAMDKAYDTFAEVYGQAGKEINGKIDTLASAFSILEEVNLPLLSAVGKVGTTICRRFKANEEIPQFRGNQAGINKATNNGFINAVHEKVEALANSYESFTTIGVSGNALPDHFSFASAFDKARNQTIHYVRTAVNDAINETFGRSDNLEETTRKLQQIFVQVIADPKTASFKGGLALAAEQRLIDIKNEIQQNLRDLLGRVTLFTDGDGFRRLVELQLWASYFAELFKGDKYEDATVPDAIATRLASKELNILELKTGKGQTAAIYGRKRIPWEGHPNHKRALGYFFEWYADNVKPFDVVVNQTNLAKIDNSMKSYIETLGKAIAAHKVTHVFGHDTVNVEALDKELGRKKK